MNRIRSRRPAARPRRGVTLIELIVAVTILMLGLLSIVGISATITRSLGQARQEQLAAMAAQSRFERLAGTACADLNVGSVQQVSSRNITERYVVIDAGNNTRMLHDTVTWNTYRSQRKIAFKTLIPCRPGA
jgi:prepilin-type N-terminal cleavage/methylation domain-containing protein